VATLAELARQEVSPWALETDGWSSRWRSGFGSHSAWYAKHYVNPADKLCSIDAIADTPLSTPTNMSAGGRPELVGSVAKIYRSADPAVIDHYTVQRVMDVNASVAERDLGSTTSDVQKAIGSLGKLPANQKIVIRGESQAMRESFITLAAGLVLAIVLVYLLMVANFPG
jgi:multidrug efflux pump subunit AcrB